MACRRLLLPSGAEHPEGPAWSPVWGEKLPPAQMVSLVNQADPAQPGSRVRQSKARQAAGLLQRGLWRDLKAVLQLASLLYSNALPR